MNARWILIAAIACCAGCDTGPRDRRALAVANEAPKPADKKLDPAEIAKIRTRERTQILRQGSADPVSKPTTDPATKVPTEPKPPEKEEPIPPLNIEPLPEEVKVKAEPGVSGSVRDLGDTYLAATFNAAFELKEKNTYRQLKDLVEVYMVDHRHYPRSHAEFMKEIVEKNGFNLPELPEGSRYHFDPKDGELYVVKMK